jgi:diguanylate cyclase (GGDEF)-like protein
MIMFDIDNLKRLNDIRGHAAGDCAIRTLARQVKTMLRSQDVFARTGGDEFIILLPDTLASTGLVAAERVRQSLEMLEIPFETGPIKLTVSAGVAQFDLAHGGMAGMMRRADAATYKAKEHGRNSVVAQSLEAAVSEAI